MIYGTGKGVGYRKRKHTIDIIYVPQTRRKIGLGVRTDNIIHVRSPEKRHTLKFSSTCLCGSLSHRSTRSPHCLLSSQYMDA